MIIRVLQTHSRCANLSGTFPSYSALEAQTFFKTSPSHNVLHQLNVDVGTVEHCEEFS